MAKRKAKKAKKKDTNANLGFEAKLWLAADKLRNNMDAAEYKHTVLGLIFLKYISDAFDEHHAKLIARKGDYEGADPEDPDEYRAENVFWVPKEARWQELQNSAKQPTIGKLIDDAMEAIERDNPRLKGTLTKNYARPALDKQRLGELVDLIGTIELVAKREAEDDEPDADPPEAHAAHHSKDILGRVYEYFLSEFASAEGKKGGQFYTPSCVVRTLVEMLRARRHLSSRPGQRSQSRLRHRQSAVQRQRLAPQRRRRALEIRHASQRQRQLCVGAALHPPPESDGHRRIRAGQRQHEQ